ncbi:MAG: aminoacylase [Firmicutes bacterium]|nr:aminoacylase [Bacillota bacterium]
MSYDMIIRNGRIIDGTGNPWYRADIGIIGDRITAIGCLSADAQRVIDAGDQIVCPGFIDMHTHSDLMVFVEPELPPKLYQGITTEVITQDGISVAPISPATELTWRKVLAAVDGDPPIPWAWSSLGDYMDALERARPGLNLVTLIPYGNVRSLVLGFGAVTPDARQLEAMKALVARGMEEGAFGMSLGLIYQPQMYATQDELTEVFRVVGRYRGIMSVHMRNEGDLLLEAADEVIQICMATGCALHISHLKVAGRRNWGKGALLMEKLEEARERGLDVTFDQYPYTAASTALHQILPPWATEGGVGKIVARLQEGAIRARIAWEIAHMVGEERPTSDPIMRFWENFVASAGWDGILITSVSTAVNKWMEGRNVSAIAAEVGKPPIELALDLLVAEECGVSMAAFIASEENVRRFLAHDFGTLGSDGLLVGKPHPRAYGTFPRALGAYVRQHGVLPLHQMIRRMTSLPAQRLGLQDRGIIRAGMKADLVIFDPDAIGDTASFGEPRQFPTGIAAVIVNGAVAVDSGNLTGARSGEVLRSSSRPVAASRRLE